MNKQFTLPSSIIMQLEPIGTEPIRMALKFNIHFNDDKKVTKVLLSDTPAVIRVPSDKNGSINISECSSLLHLCSANFKQYEEEARRKAEAEANVV